MKIAFFANHRTFITDIATKLSEDHEVRFFEQGDNMATVMMWADVAWFEFCDDLLIAATKQAKLCRIICRLHSYEVFTPFPAQVDWRKVDTLVFVARHVLEFFRHHIPYRPEMVLIPNGLDTAKFTIPKDKKRGKKIASVGYINYKKNPGLLLYCYQKIHQFDPSYSLHIAGQFQDQRIEYYMKYYADKNALPLQIDGWVEDMPKWYDDKDYVISTSYWESFHFSIAEGMASGLMPLIHAWPGSDTIYPTRFLFNGPDECLELLQRLEGTKEFLDMRESNRKFISRYDIDTVFEQVVRLLETGRPRPEVSVDSSEPTNITLCMIVCDEERGIGRAIESVKNLVDGVVILVDTKTTDKTAEIAEALGAKVIPYKWIDDFSDARNKAMEAAETDWVLVLDGHEYVVGDIKLIKQAMKEYPDITAIDLPVRMENGKIHYHGRLHKKEAAHWENEAHNVLYAGGTTVAMKDVDENDMPRILVQHDRYGGQSEDSRNRRNTQRDVMLVKVLSKRIEKNEKDTRSLFYLAQQHRDAHRWEEAFHYYNLYNNVEGGNQWPEESFQAYYEAGKAALALDNKDEALKQGLLATKRLPQRAEGWALAGDVSYAMNNWEDALKYFKKASDCPSPTDARLWVDHELHKGGWKVMDALTMCYWHLGNFKEGAAACEKLLENPELPEGHKERVKTNLAWHRDRQAGDDFDALAYWEKRYEKGWGSGAGSRGRLAEYKATIINGLLLELGAKYMMDHGCGDGHQASLFKCKRYVGLDVSTQALKLCKEKFNGDSDKEFYDYEDAPEDVAELATSLDVIYHLTDDKDFEEYMYQLFSSASRCVAIYSTNVADVRNLHIKHREFVRWIADNIPGWELVNALPNPYPYNPQDANQTSLSNFFIFTKS